MEQKAHDKTGRRKKCVREIWSHSRTTCQDDSVARRNAYTISVFNQINELSVYPAKALLLLEKYDKAPMNMKKQIAQELTTYVDGFENLRTNFEAVFSETRMLNNPEGYQLDSNLHEHLANGTNNTDWMFMYEVPFNTKVSEWLTAQQSANK
jgi:hexosaminidase